MTTSPPRRARACDLCDAPNAKHATRLYGGASVCCACVGFGDHTECAE